MTETPSPFQIAQECAVTQDYTPIADFAKTVCGSDNPYDSVWVAGFSLTRWQAKVFEARAFAILGAMP